MAASERIKIDRKALREPDEFQVLSGRATAWVRANRTAVAAGAGVLAVLVLVWLGVGWYRGRLAAAAAVRFGAAHAELVAGRYAEAAESFAGLGRDYRATPFGRLAGLYRGHALAAQGDAAGAASAYAGYLEGSPGTEYLRQQALVGLGRAREAGGEAAQAREAFAQAADVPGPFRTEARLGLARLAEAAGDAGAAREIYAALLAEVPAGMPLRDFLESKAPAAAVQAPAAGTAADPAAAPAPGAAD